MGNARQEHLMRKETVFLEAALEALFQDAEMLREAGRAPSIDLIDAKGRIERTMDIRRQDYKARVGYEEPPALLPMTCHECEGPAWEKFHDIPYCNEHYTRMVGVR